MRYEGYRHITVVLGLPSSSSTMILGEIDSTPSRLLLALEDRRKPTPPTDALLEFFDAEEVTSW